jgi:Kef-type K+ transport system membrane component KefB
MELFYIILVLLLLSRLFGELTERFGQPSLVGELIAGISLGILVHQYSGAFPVLAGIPEDEIFIAITDLAIFFLMLLAGLELYPAELAKASTKAFTIAVGGMLFPLAIGFGLGWLFIPESDFKLAQTLFIATTLAVTAIPVAAKVLMEFGQLRSKVGQTIISAAIFDNILSLLLLAVLTSVIKTGGLPDAAHLIELVGQILLFFTITGIIGYFVFPFLGRCIKKFHSGEMDFSGLLIAALFYSLLAEWCNLHFILGAFVAGLFFTHRTIDETSYQAVTSKITGITEGFLAPLFFVSIGIHLDLSAATSIPGFVIILTMAALLCKVIGAGWPAYWQGFNKKDALAVGVSMSARGAVELIIAGIALRAGLFAQPEPTPPIIQYLFSAVVIMAIITTLLTPMLLKRVMEPANPVEKPSADSGSP